jgi:PAS domain S-box-containing protein
MSGQLFINLVYNASLLLVLVTLYSGIRFRVPFGSGLPSSRRDVITGLLAGVIGVAVMVNPWRMQAGIFFDARAMLLAVTGLFFGFVPAVLAVVITAAYRIAADGAGALAGVAVIIASAGLGLLWRAWRPGLPERGGLAELCLFAVLLHLLQLACFLLLPWPLSLEVLRRVALPLMTVFPAGTVLLCLLLIHQRRSGNMENDLRESEAKFRALFENSNDAIFLHGLGPGGRAEKFAEVNRLACERLGYSREELLALSPADIDAGHMREARRAALDRLARDGQAVFEMWHRAKDGRELPVEISARVFGYGGRSHALSIARDITARRAAADELREAKNLLESIVENIPLMLFLKDAADLRYVLFNKAGEELLGHSRGDLLGKSDLDFFPAAQAEFFISKDREVLKACGSVDIPEEPIDTARKGRRLLHTRKVCIKGADGTAKHLLGISEDITERKELEAAAVKAREAIVTLAQRNELLLESLGEGVYGVDKEGEITFANKAAEEILGYSAADLIGRHSHTLFHHAKPGGSPYHSQDCPIYATSRDGQERRVESEVFWKKDGAAVQVEYLATPVKESGLLTGAVVCFTDITQRKRAETEKAALEARLLQSQKMEAVGRLAGGVAHDFNNILTAIKYYAGVIRDGFADDAPSRTDAIEILTASDRAAALTRQLLTFSRRQVIMPKVVDLNPIIADMIKMLKSVIGEDIILETGLSGTPCLVLADSGQLEQVVMNLAVNARDAMPKGGTLTLATEIVAGDAKSVAARRELPPGQLVRFTARDTGHGMTDEVKSHAFEPFFTTKPAGRGTGLGLATILGIVKQSGGEIELESEPGKGTAFFIYLPLAEGDGRTAAKPPEKQTSLRGRETVLLVEDDRMLRRLGERLLAENGYTVISAANGTDALQALEQYGRPVDLLITDVVMPGMNGRELALEIARRGLAGRTLYMSGYTDEAISKHGVLEPGLAFIYKPFTADGLAAKLREVLEGPADQARP